MTRNRILGGLNIRIIGIFIFIGVQLIYKAVLVSGIQQSDSVIYIYIYAF